MVSEGLRVEVDSKEKLLIIGNEKRKQHTSLIQVRQFSVTWENYKTQQVKYDTVEWM